MRQYVSIVMVMVLSLSLLGASMGSAEAGVASTNVTNSMVNQAPVANAGQNQYAQVNTSVTFWGNGSYDPDMDNLTYHWTFGDGSNSGWMWNPITSHAYTMAGNYTVYLLVTDGALFDNDTCWVLVTGALGGNNTAPVANAGSNQNAQVNQWVNFNGNGSNDPDGDNLTYRWTFGDGGQTNWSSSPLASHKYTMGGNYTVTLYVSDGALQDTDTCWVNVSGGGGNNTAPVANAGSNQNAQVNQWVNFNGNGSNDPDGDNLTYRWTFGDGGSTNWSSSPLASHKYTNGGNYTVTLYVSDGALQDTDTCWVNVSGGGGNNTAPVANAGSNQNAQVNQWVNFNGNGSNDPDGDNLTYRWTFGDGGQTNWSSSPLASHKYTNGGNYTVTLYVSDGALQDTDTCWVNVSGGGSNNAAPVAHAGPDRNGQVNQQITFYGNSSYDPDGDNLSYMWNFGDNTTSGWIWTVTTTHSYSFASNFQVTLTVSDGSLTDWDTCWAFITGPGNQPPSANAGSNQNALTGQIVNFSAAGSTDPDGDPLSYNWYFGDNTSTGWGDHLYTSHSYSSPNIYTVTLYVSDGELTDTDTCMIGVTDPVINQPPVADAGDDQTVMVGQSIQLSADGSYDADGDLLTFRWEFGDGASKDWSDDPAASHSYSAPGEYTVTLHVSDGSLEVTDTCTVTVPDIAENRPPVADAGPDLFAEVGETLLLHGNGTYDPDGDPLVFSWEFGDGMGTKWDELLSTSHSYRVAGEYTVTLHVSDGALKAIDTCTVTVTDVIKNLPPIADAGANRNVTTGQSVQFSGDGSYDPDGDELTYRWDFGDGTSTGWEDDAEAEYSYASHGTFRVTLSVSDGEFTDTDTCIVMVTRADADNPDPDGTDDTAGDTDDEDPGSGFGTDTKESDKGFVGSELFNILIVAAILSLIIVVMMVVVLRKRNKEETMDGEDAGDSGTLGPSPIPILPQPIVKRPFTGTGVSPGSSGGVLHPTEAGGALPDNIQPPGPVPFVGVPTMAGGADVALQPEMLTPTPTIRSLPAHRGTTIGELSNELMESREAGTQGCTRDELRSLLVAKHNEGIVSQDSYMAVMSDIENLRE